MSALALAGSRRVVRGRFATDDRSLLPGRDASRLFAFIFFSLMGLVVPLTAFSSIVCV